MPVPMDRQNFNFLLTLQFWIYISIGFSIALPSVVSQISLGSKLSPSDKTFWVSSNGDFALTFFNSSSQPYQFSVGIRFYSNSIPDDKQTVVWVAGANVAVSDSSYFQLTQQGDLVLFDSSKNVVAWSSNTSQFSVSSAVLHDNGNLVLLDDRKVTVWQSFDIPSNTLLPGQRLTVKHSLRAAAMDSLASYYTLYMNATGELQLRWDSNVVFWSVGKNTNANTTSAVFTLDGSLYLVDKKSSDPVWSLYGADHGDIVSYRFLRLDTDGNLRMYSWDTTLFSWRTVWQAVENQCYVFAICGQRGICSLNNSGSIQCSCPFGLLNNLNNPKSNSHCLVPYQQGCRSGSVMLEYQEVFLHGMYPPTDYTIQASLDQCKSVCQRDRLCTAATFMNDGSARCLLKTTRYLTGYSDSGSTKVVSFVKKCLDPVAVDPRSSSPSTPTFVRQETSNKFCIPCLVGAASATLVMFFTIQVLVGLYVYKKRKSIWIKSSMSARTNRTPNPKGLMMFSFTEIKEVTDIFKHRIGPNMYKGTISATKRSVAVKDLQELNTVEERSFRSTVSKLGSIHHRNLVKLEGYCCETTHKYLVYEYAKNSSLDKYIEDPELSKQLTWSKRMEICIDVAKALSYLHTECREFISHGNLKCSNIVFDEYFEAKVTEFGLVKIRKESSSRDMSAEKDVEDFGHVMMGLVSGCFPGSAVYSLEKAYGQWEEGRVCDLVDKRVLADGLDMDEVERVVRIAFWCVQSNERMRPSMGEVMKVLEGTLVVDPPPSPFSRADADEDSSGSGSGS